MARRGYRMHAKTDRCDGDYDLRHVRDNIAEGERSLQSSRAELADASDPREIARLRRRIEVAEWALRVARENERRLVRLLAELYPAPKPVRTCNEDGCSRPALYHGWCAQCDPFAEEAVAA